jgi:hypothetical protein
MDHEFQKDLKGAVAIHSNYHQNISLDRLNKILCNSEFLRGFCFKSKVSVCSTCGHVPRVRSRMFVTVSDQLISIFVTMKDKDNMEQLNTHTHTDAK